MSQVDAFDVASVHERVAGSAFARIHFVAQTGSTNDDARALLGTPGSEGLVIVTDFQRTGRGRRDRRWIAPPGSSLLCTTILPAPVAASALWAVPFWTALCVADGLENAYSVRAGLKWPNDLLLGGRKAGGILCLSRVVAQEASVACGVGLNVLRPRVAEDLEGIDPQPAFLSDAANVTREATLAAILLAYEARLPLLSAPQTVARLWEARAALRGTRYTISADDTGTTVNGTALRIDTDGALIAEVAGAQRRFPLAETRIERDANV